MNERGLVVDHQRKEGTFRHSKNPPDGYCSTKAFDRCHEQRHRAKGEHHTG